MGRIRLDRGERYLDEAFMNILFKRDFTRVEQLLHEAGDMGLNTTELCLYRGLIPLLLGQPQSAIDVLEKAYDLDPDRAETCYALAYACQSIADSAKWQQFIERAKEHEIDSALGWLLRGLAFSETGGDDAIESYNRAIKMRPDFTLALEVHANYRAIRLLTEGKREELDPMLNDYEAWKTFQPESHRSYTGRAFGWLAAAAYARTQADLQERSSEWLARCEQDPEHALSLKQGDDMRALTILGTYRRFIGDVEGSVEAYERANAVYRATAETDHPGIVHNEAISLYMLDDLKGALQDVQRACGQWPAELFPLPLQRALLLAELGRLDEARTACRESLEPERANATRLFTSAVGMELLGEPDASRAALQAFMKEMEDGALLEGTERARFLPALTYLEGSMDAETLLQKGTESPGLTCEFTFLVALRELGGGGIRCNQSSPVIHNCVIRNNTGFNGGGISVCASSSPIIIQSTISDNHASSMNKASGIHANGGAIHCWDQSSMTLSHCTFYGNSASQEGHSIYCGADGYFTMHNSILWDSANNDIAFADGSGSMDHTDVWSAYPGTGNITSDPQFVDAAHGDFHIRYISPCRDTGDNSAVTITEDFEGDPRIALGIADMGADEFHTHFYCTGDFGPGMQIEGKIIGLPDTQPIGIFFGSGVLGSPLSTKWGAFRLDAPWVLVGPLWPIPSDGVMLLPAEHPVSTPAAYDLPMQAYVGGSLSNLFVLEVRQTSDLITQTQIEDE